MPGCVVQKEVITCSNMSQATRTHLSQSLMESGSSGTTAYEQRGNFDVETVDKILTGAREKRDHAHSLSYAATGASTGPVECSVSVPD
jgi:hypothetical protein